MNTSILIALTIFALLVSFAAAAFVFKKTNARHIINASTNFNSLAAEDLIGVVIGVPLDQIIVPGDTVEIIIKTNGHPLIGCEYSVRSWCGQLKLTRKTGV